MTENVATPKLRRANGRRIRLAVYVAVVVVAGVALLCVAASAAAAKIGAVVTAAEFQAANNAQETPAVCSGLKATAAGKVLTAPAVRAAVTSCLNQLGYMPSTGYSHAVKTFQKRHGLARDGVVGPVTLRTLQVAKHVLMPPGCRRADTACADLSQQVLYIYKPTSGGRELRAIDISSGNGEEYVNKQGVKQRAVTPLGRAFVCRQVAGEDPSRAVDGILYHPSYLNFGSGCSGVAVHGSNSVPGYPASHACLRITQGNKLWVFTVLEPGKPDHPTLVSIIA